MAAATDDDDPAAAAPARKSPWSGFKRIRTNADNREGGGDTKSPKSAKLEVKDEQQAHASVSSKDWFWPVSTCIFPFFAVLFLHITIHTLQVCGVSIVRVDTVSKIQKDTAFFVSVSYLRYISFSYHIFTEYLAYLQDTLVR